MVEVEHKELSWALLMFAYESDTVISWFCGVKRSLECEHVRLSAPYGCIKIRPTNQRSVAMVVAQTNQPHLAFIQKLQKCEGIHAGLELKGEQ